MSWSTEEFFSIQPLGTWRISANSYYSHSGPAEEMVGLKGPGQWSGLTSTLLTLATEWNPTEQTIPKSSIIFTPDRHC